MRVPSCRKEQPEGFDNGDNGAVRQATWGESLPLAVWGGTLGLGRWTGVDELG